MSIGGVRADFKVELPKTQNSQSTTQTQTGEEVYEGFKFNKGNNTYTLTNTTKNEPSGNVPSEASAKSLLSQITSGIADGKSQISDGNSQQSDAQQTQMTSTSIIENGFSTIDKENSSIKNETANINKSNENLGKINNKQHEINSWIENTSPGIEEMAQQVIELQAEGLKMIADAGIQEEFGSFEEAIAAIQDMIDPDAMKEIEEKTELRNQKEQEMNSLPEGDPKKEELKSEIEGLDTEIGNLNQTDSGLTMTQLSELMEGLQDTMGAISTLQESINDFHTELDAKEEALSELGDQTQTENAAIEGSNKNIGSSKNSITMSQKEVEANIETETQTSNGLTDAGGVVSIVGGAGETLSGVCVTVGEALTATGYGAGVGAALTTYGSIGAGVFGLVTATGQGMTQIGQAQLAEANGQGTSADTAAATASAVFGIGTAAAKGAAATIVGVHDINQQSQTNIDESRKKTDTSTTKAE